MTVIHTLAGVDFGDNTMPVLANDSFANVGTQLILDFGNAKCWPGGAPLSTSTTSNLANLPAVKGAFKAGSRPTFSGGAMHFAGTVASDDAMVIQKDGAIGLPFFPSGDGDYLDTLLVCWFTPSVRPASNAGVIGIGRSGTNMAAMGFQHHSSGNIYEYNTNQMISADEPNGIAVQIAAHYAYNEMGGTTSIRLYRNGAYIKTISGSNPTLLTQEGNSKAFIGGFAGASNGFNGAIHRCIIDQTSVSGLNPDSLVEKDWSLNHARFGL